MNLLIVFICSLLLNFLASKEIYSIAKRKLMECLFWTTLRSAMSVSITILIVIEQNRWELLGPYVLGDVVGTYVALRGMGK